MTPADLRTGDDDDQGPAGPDFEPIVPPRKKKSGKLWLGVAVVASVAAGAAAWQYFGEDLMMDSDANIPLVRADEGPVKVQPESPGGMDVPDRDKLVYDRIDGSGEERSSVERLLPPPETPMPLPETPAQENAQAEPSGSEAMASGQADETPPPPPAPGGETDSASSGAAAGQAETPTVEEVLGAMRPPEAQDPQNIKTPAEPAPEAPAAAEPVKPATEVAEIDTKTPVTEAAKAQETAKAAEPALKPAPAEMPVSKLEVPAGFKVQLAALRAEDAAMKEWERLSRRNKDLLGSLKPSVMRADLGAGKGIFFRLRAGPLPSEAEAKALCEKLKSRKVGCLIVRPEG